MDIIKRFERTKAAALITIPLATLLLAITQVPDLEKISALPIDKRFLFNGVLTLLFILLIVFVLETLFVIFGGSKILSLFFGTLLNIIGWVTGFITKVWIFLLKPFIEPVVKEILKERAFINKTFFLRNKYLGREDDDDFVREVYSAKKITIVCRPTKAFPRWRLGIKFSNDGEFPLKRVDSRHYLFHLTKDQGNNDLFYHFYQTVLTHNYRKIVTNYSHDPIKIVIISNKETHINIYNMQNTLLDSVKTTLFEKLQISAWADGQSDFELEVKMIEY